MLLRVAVSCCIGGVALRANRCETGEGICCLVVVLLWLVKKKNHDGSVDLVCKYCAELLFCTQRLALRDRSSLVNVFLLVILARSSWPLSLLESLLTYGPFLFYLTRIPTSLGLQCLGLRATAPPAPRRADSQVN